MKTLAPAVLLLCLSIASADEFLVEFEALKQAGDHGPIEEFLEKAAVEEVDNPDYYAAAGNYWWGLAGSVTMSPDPIKPGNFEVDANDLSIIDPKTGKKVGSIGPAGKVNPEIPKRALKVLTDGARKFPARADILLGLAHVQKEMGSAEGYVDTLTALLAEARKDPGALKWKKGEALPNPAETFLPETVQTYSAALFNANTPATDALCARLLAAVTDTFPDHPYAYNMRAALADATGKPEEALRMLETAHQKDPGDSLILMNLGEAYAKSGQSRKAIATYEKVLKLEVDPRSRQKAEAALERIKMSGANGPGTGPGKGAE